MKQILIVDEHPLFREYLKEKLNIEKIQVEIATDEKSSFTKLHANLPDLIIYGTQVSFDIILRFLKKKSNNKNTKNIPVILIGEKIEKEKIAELALYKIIKYFTRPIKIDVLCEIIGSIIGKTISLDITPCLMDVHVNNNILFIEIAKGLNREKLILLKYRIIELLDEYNFENPQVILMLTNLTLSFMDGPNLENLINNVLFDTRIRGKNMKILSFDDFTKKFIRGHPQYASIEIVSDISNILGKVVNRNINDASNAVINNILTETADSITSGTIQLAFFNDSKDGSSDQKLFGGIKIAIVQENDTILYQIKKAFKSFPCKVDLFYSGLEFLLATNKINYDIVVLDIFLKGITGFDILVHFHEKKYYAGVIIYSPPCDKQDITRALNLGANYFITQDNPATLVAKKASKILKNRI
ncbi:MAG: response regulator [Treponemataceae bacterium]